MDDRIIIFTHVPKTGGTSVTSMFEKMYGKERVFRYTKHPSDNARFLKSKNMKVVAGHIWYGLHGELGIENPLYVGFVRNPVDRLVSMYHYCKREKNHIWHTEARQKSIKEFYSSGKNTELRCYERIFGGIDGIDQNYLYVGLTECLEYCCEALIKRLGNHKIHLEKENMGAYPTELDQETRSFLLNESKDDFAIYGYVAGKIAKSMI